MWTFDFTIQHASVFANHLDKLGALLVDCDGVPMITELTETAPLQPFLNTSSELKNIDFEIIHYEEPNQN